MQKRVVFTVVLVLGVVTGMVLLGVFGSRARGDAANGGVPVAAAVATALTSAAGPQEADPADGGSEPGAVPAEESPVAAELALFAQGYETGHEFAGFTGRPMLLVFSRAGDPAVAQVLRDCEADPRIAALLRETFQGVSVDPAREPEVHALYGSPETTSLLVKDLRGPHLGLLTSAEAPIDAKSVLALLESALPQVEVVKSPAYTRLLEGIDLLDELVGKEERAEAARVVRLFERYEKGSPAAIECRARATALDLDVGP
jgi:hypothetical protein